MNTEILGVAVQIVLMVVLAYPLGRYIARVYKGEKTWSDFMAPIERVIYKICGINPQEEMNWKQFLKALLILNAFWFVWGMVLLVSQGWLPLNPDGIDFTQKFQVPLVIDGKIISTISEIEATVAPSLHRTS